MLYYLMICNSLCQKNVNNIFSLVVNQPISKHANILRNQYFYWFDYVCFSYIKIFLKIFFIDIPINFYSNLFEQGIEILI
jgi:hypothetical protein